jgi:hypothetical protein
MSLIPEKKQPALGTARRPWRDVWFENAQGLPQSIREIEGGGGQPDQPFFVDELGDVVMDPDRITEQGRRPAAPDVIGYMDAPYVGPEEPGTDPNVLTNGYSRIWSKPTGEVYLVAKIRNLYFTVELTASADQQAEP